MNKIYICVSVAALTSLAYADQGGLISAPGGSLGAISIANPPGTLSIAPPNLTFISTDGSTAINAVFSTNNTTESCSGGGKGGHITCSFTFTGAFSGTLNVNGAVQAISGSTTQYYGSSGLIGGATGYNSAYTPFYFTDGNARILRADDLNGSNAISYGSQGTGAGEFYGPSGIALDSAGRIYITDTYNDRIVRIDDMNGTNWTAFGTYGTDVGQFTLPQSVTVDPTGHIWVLDGSRLIRMDDMNGTNWTVIGSAGSGVGQFGAIAAAPAFDSLGRIYVADVVNRWIARFDDLNFTNWTTLSQSQPAGPYIYMFGQLYGVAVDPAGKIYVASDRNVIRVDDMTGANWSSISIGTFPAHTIAVDPSGMVLLGNGYEAQIVDSEASVFTSNIDGEVIVNGVYAEVYGAVPIPLPSPRPSAIRFSPETLTFSQNVNSTSDPQNITISNFGGSPLSGLTVSAAAPFSQMDNCPGTLQAGASCTVPVSFTPSTTTPVMGWLTVSDNSGNAGTSQKLELDGSGTTPAATVTPKSLSFNSQVIGTTSTARTITVQSTGTGPLQVSTIAVSGPFAETGDNCIAAPIAAGLSCTISVSFSPTVAGNASGTVTITDNAGTQTVSLSGSGVAPITFSPSSLSFGSLAVGSTSAARTVTVTNHLSTVVSVSSIAATGPFAIASNTCGTSIAANGNCTVGVTFTPAATGAASGTLTFTDTANTSPQGVALSGTGTAAVTFSTNSISFNGTVVGQTSSSRSVTLTNEQTSALSFTSIVASAGFSIASSTCGPGIAAGANCTVGVTFSPTSVGSITGTLTFTDSAATSPQVVNLSGTGNAPVTFSTSSLNFGTVTVNTTSSAKTVTVTNRLSSALTLGSVTASAGFIVSSNSCGTSIPAGGKCSVSVEFSPTAAGLVQGSLSFTDGALTSPQSVTLTGTGR